MGMVVYFVRYVVEPEMHGQCKDAAYREEHWQCSSINVTGACFTCLLFAAVFANPVWLIVAKKMGKVQAWIFWSITSTVTNFAFLTCGHGWFGGMENEYLWIMFLSCMNGIPFGGKFLADSILSDTIDYDEFLSGMRCEGVYTMFKGFLPKISAIPAVALPVALLQALGHKSPIDGVVQKQDPIIKVYCLIICGVVTPLFCVAGTYIKMQFPLKEAAQYSALTHGISQHLQHKKAADPLTSTVYKPFESNPGELHLVFLLDAFPNYETILELETNIDGKADDRLVAKCQCELITAIVMMVLLFVATTVSYIFFMVMDGRPPSLHVIKCRSLYPLSNQRFHLFPSTFAECAINDHTCSDDEARYSSMDDLVPVFFVICFGVSVTVSCFFGLRLGNAKEIKELGLVYNKDLLNRVKLHRIVLAKINKLPINPPLEHPEDYSRRVLDEKIEWSHVPNEKKEEEATDANAEKVEGTVSASTPQDDGESRGGGGEEEKGGGGDSFSVIDPDVAPPMTPV